MTRRRAAISLVLTTLGARPSELERFLASLTEQESFPAELIVVDQSGGDAVLDALAPFREALPIRHARSDRGLSLGRNVGIALATGDVIGFPDDDCWYPPRLLTNVSYLFDSQPTWQGITCVTRDAEGRLSLARFLDHGGRVTLRALWRQAVEPATFLRLRLLESIGGFDESLGVGATSPFQAGEGTDLLARGLADGHYIRFVPELWVHHPNPEALFDDRAYARARSYGRGIGRVLRTNRMPLCVAGGSILRPLVGSAIAAASGNRGLSLYRWNAFRGRLEGLVAPAHPTGRR